MVILTSSDLRNKFVVILQNIWRQLAFILRQSRDSDAGKPPHESTELWEGGVKTETSAFGHGRGLSGLRGGGGGEEAETSAFGRKKAKISAFGHD